MSIVNVIFDEFKVRGYSDEDAKILSEIAESTLVENPYIGDVVSSMDYLLREFKNFGDEYG